MTCLVFIVLAVLLASENAQALISSDRSQPASHKNPVDSQGQQQTLVVSSEQDYPPFATGITDASAGGFTADLWKAVAAESNLKYTIRVLPFHQLLQEFKDSKVDLLLNLALSDERHKFADFSVPYATVHGAIFVRKGAANDIRTEDDLASKSIIVLNADLAHQYALSKGWAQQLVLVDTAAQGMRLLASGRHDVMLLGKLVGVQTLQALGLSDIEALKVKLGFQQKFSFATLHGQPELLATLNEGLSITMANGTYNTLYEKWFGSYEVKEVGWRDLLQYILPLFILFLLVAGYFFYRWQVERSRVQAVIAESRNLLLTVIDTAPLRVFWKDRNSRYLGCHMLFAQDAGVAYPRDLIGKDDFQMPWAAQADSFRADDRAVMKTGIAKLSYDELQMALAGNMIWRRKSKVSLKNQHNETIGVLGICEDITVRRDAEEKLCQLSAAVEQSSVSVVIADLQACIEYVNPGFTQATGYSAAEALGHNPRILHSGQTPKEVFQELWGRLTSGQSWRGEFVNKRKNNEIYWEGCQIAPVKNPAGSVTHYVAVKIDISARKRLESELKESLSRLEKIASRLPGVVFQFRMRPDGSSCFPYASTSMVEIFGLDPQDVREDPSKVFSVFHPDDHDWVLATIHSSARDLTLWSQEFRLKFADGTVHWMHINAKPQKEEDGDVLWHSFMTDTTEHKNLEIEIQDAREFAENIVESVRESLLVLDSELRILTANHSFYECFKVTPAETIGKFIYDLGNRQWDIAKLRILFEEILPNESVLSDYEVAHEFPVIGQKIFLLNAREIFREEIGSQIVLLAMEDITERKLLEDQVRQLAFHDALTKLPNRRLLHDRMSQTMAASKRSGKYVALIYLDLDNFKPLNDEHGHDAADLLLV